MSNFLLGEILTTQQVADKLGIAVNNINKKCREGRIPHIKKIGGRWLIPASSFPAFLVRKTRTDKGVPRKKTGEENNNEC